MDGVLYNKAKTQILYYPSAKEDEYFIIPNTVTEIMEYAFNSCNNLKYIFIPERITSIESRTFSYCNNLTTVFIPKSVTFICNYAFEECRNLVNVHYDGVSMNGDKSGVQFG